MFYVRKSVKNGAQSNSLANVLFRKGDMRNIGLKEIECLSKGLHA